MIRTHSRLARAVVIGAIAVCGVTTSSVSFTGGPLCGMPSSSGVALVTQLDPPAKRFGTSVSIDGDWVAVGIPGDTADKPGLVELFHRAGGLWTSHSIIAPPDSAPGDEFGFSVSLRGTTVLVGAVAATGVEPMSGAAHVFQFVDGAWTHEATLLAPDGKASDQLGADVALDGEWALVGAKEHDSPGVGAGAAYLFARERDGWQLISKLPAPDLEPGDRFGTSVEMDGGIIAVGATGDDGPGDPLAGSVRIFEQVDGAWVQTSRITPLESLYPDASGNFGKLLVLRGDRLLVNATFGAPSPMAQGGAALSYSRIPPRGDSGSQWAPPELFVSQGCYAGDDNSLAIDPEGTVAAFLGSGGNTSVVRLLWRDERGWSSERYLHASPNWPTGPTVGAVAMSGAEIVAARTHSGSGSNIMGRAFVAVVPPRDRNFNGLADACELANSLAEDCDQDGIIDDAERPFRYLSQPLPPTVHALTLMVQSVPLHHVLSLNRFVVTDERGTLSALGLARPDIGNMPTFQTAVVYLDPDGDGHPYDAELIHSQIVSTGGVEEGEWERIPIDPIYIGPVGTSFFVGTNVAIGFGVPFAPVDLSWPQRTGGWLVWSTQPLDLVELKSNTPFALETMNGAANFFNFLLAAELTDCDDSERLDQCELADGTLEDLDGDGIPDACAAPFGDLDGDGQVRSDDLAVLLLQWGECPARPSPCAADLNDDGVVDGDDLGRLLTLWM